MAARDNLHSRVVFWLKIILPLIALSILSTLFLVSRTIDTDLALPYAEVDVEDLARDQRLTAPEFSAVTSDGAALTILAAEARPGGAGSGGSASDVSASYETPTGLHIAVAAREGRIDDTSNSLSLSGDVSIETSSGYRITSPGLVSSLDRTDIHSDGEVRAEAPYGQIDAGMMQLGHEDAETSGYVLLFSKGVKLIYLPPEKEEP